MRFASSLLLGLLAFGCGGPERPVFTEAPATTMTVPPPVASSSPRPADSAGNEEDTNNLPLADDGMGGDVGSDPPRASIAIAPSVAGAPRGIDPARDPRARNNPRQRTLLVTELQGLSSLLAATSQTAPDRPMLVRRIAEDYAELARAALASNAAADPLARTSRTKAIDFYTQLEAFSGYAKLDEALYFKGLELEMSGDVTNARRAYYDLIRKSPTSKFVSYAYFAFGEMFFDEAAADPSKNDLALQAYNEVLKQPGPLAPESLLRSGLTAERKNDRPKALQFFKRLLQTHPGTSAARAVPSWASRP